MTRWVVLALALAVLLGACGRYGRPVRPKSSTPPPAAAMQEAPEPAEPSSEAAEDDEEE